MKKSFTLLAALTIVMSMFAAQETVYFVNAQNWAGPIKVHAWDGTANDTEWPGLSATKEAEKIGDFDVYSFTAEAGAYKKIIFNNNGSPQTGNLDWTAGKYFVKDDWYTKEEAIAKVAEPVEYESVYFVNAYDWPTVNIYTWSPEIGTWPGLPMTKETEQIGGKDVYSYTVEKGTSFGGLNFNGGGDEFKTGDLQWTAGKYYVKDGWYTKEEAVEKLTGAGSELPSVVLVGEMNGWNTSTNIFKAAEDLQTASVTVTLEVKTYAFKIIVNNEWLGNYGTMDRSNCSGWLFEKFEGVEETNAHITADKAGDYVFTWTYADDKLSVTYPSTTSLDNIAIENKATKIIRNGQMFILRDGVMYNSLGQIAQ